VSCSLIISLVLLGVPALAGHSFFRVFFGFISCCFVVKVFEDIDHETHEIGHELTRTNQIRFASSDIDHLLLTAQFLWRRDRWDNVVFIQFVIKAASIWPQITSVREANRHRNLIVLKVVGQALKSHFHNDLRCWDKPGTSLGHRTRGVVRGRWLVVRKDRNKAIFKISER
jgi:hypothetical protein